MKKQIFIILVVFMMVVPSVFGVVGYTLTYDIQTCLQNMLQKMNDLEHYANVYKKWAEDLAQYKRQIEQMETYYKQLKGVGESLGKGSVLDVWNNSKKILETASNMCESVDGITISAEKDYKKCKDTYSETKNKINDLNFNKNEIDLEIKKLEEKYYIDIRSEWLNSFSKRDCYTHNITKKQWDDNINTAIRYEQDYLKNYKLLINDIDSSIDITNKTISDMNEILSNLKNNQNILIESKKEITTSINTLEKELQKQRDANGPERTIDDLESRINTFYLRINQINEELPKLKEQIDNYSSTSYDNEGSIYFHQMNISALNLKKIEYKDLIAEHEEILKKYNELKNFSVN